MRYRLDPLGLPAAAIVEAGRLEERVSMAKKGEYKPGQTCPTSGQWEIVGPRGGSTEKERTVVKGEPFPPTPEPGQKYKLVDPTKH
jgi:hypothetical protein